MATNITLNRRLAKIEQRIIAVAARCDVCGGRDGHDGLRFVIAPDEPTPIPPCIRCGRVPDPLTFMIVLAERPGTPPVTVRRRVDRTIQRAVMAYSGGVRGKRPWRGRNAVFGAARWLAAPTLPPAATFGSQIDPRTPRDPLFEQEVGLKAYPPLCRARCDVVSI